MCSFIYFLFCSFVYTRNYIKKVKGLASMTPCSNLDLRKLSLENYDRKRCKITVFEYNDRNCACFFGNLSNELVWTKQTVMLAINEPATIPMGQVNDVGHDLRKQSLVWNQLSGLCGLVISLRKLLNKTKSIDYETPTFIQ